MPGPSSLIVMTISSSLSASVTRARAPYFTAFSIRLESARLIASGLERNDKCRGAARTTSRPASTNSLLTVSSIVPISTVLLSSSVVSPRRKASVDSIILSISSRSSSIVCLSSSSLTNSVRSRNRVIGVFRSCETAARVCVRSLIRRSIRACMRLNAFAACWISIGPACDTSGAVRSIPMRSAARASVRSGAVTDRTSTNETRRMPSAIADSEARMPCSLGAV